MSGLALDQIYDTIIDGQWKGMPPGAAPMPLSAVAAQGWSLLRGDLASPVAVMRKSALTHNRRWMTKFISRHGVQLAPHGKSTMAPQLFAMQLEDGCWGLTAATANQIAVYVHFGIKRILLANQLVGAANLAAVMGFLRADPKLEIVLLTDSFAGVEQLAAAAQAAQLERPVPVLVEVGALGARTGVRSHAQGLALARTIAAAHPWLALAGVECYEGVFPDITPEERPAHVNHMFSAMVELARAIEAEGLITSGPMILSAGGTEFFDLASKIMADAAATGTFQYRPLCLVRSGCYLTHDDLAYEAFFARLRARTGLAGEGFRSALEVWASVQSCPEPGLVLVTMGKRDVGFDFGMPVAKWWSRGGSGPVRLERPALELFRLNDQHGFVRNHANLPLAPGDMIGFGISHVCTTMDRWDLIFLVDDKLEVVGGLRTFF